MAAIFHDQVVSEISVREASNRFADVMDAVEHRGETFTVVRRGRPIATIAPACRTTLGDLREFLTASPPDPNWEHDLEGPPPIRRLCAENGSAERLIPDTRALIALERDIAEPPMCSRAVPTARASWPKQVLM